MWLEILLAIIVVQCIVIFFLAFRYRQACHVSKNILAMVNILAESLSKGNVQVHVVDTDARFSNEIFGDVPIINCKCTAGKRGDQMSPCKGQQRLTEMRRTAMCTGNTQVEQLSDFVFVDAVDPCVCQAIVIPIPNHTSVIGALSLVCRVRTQSQIEGELRLQQEIAESKAAKEKAETADRTKTQFLSMMSHEIRTPLNGLLGMAQTLALSSLTTDQQEQLDTILRSGQALLRIVESILDFSKIEQGKVQITEQAFVLRTLIDDVTAVVTPKAKKHQNEIEASVADELPIIILGDVDRIYQVLVNLVSNAVKFTRNGTINVTVKEVEISSMTLTSSHAIIQADVVADARVHPTPENKLAVQADSARGVQVSVSDKTSITADIIKGIGIVADKVDIHKEKNIPPRVARTIKFIITDTGIGIEKDTLPRLFRPFTQADQSTTRNYGGTGLGLAICDRLVKLMGGEIGVSSEPGQGSTFWFTLPLRAASPGTEEIARVRSPAKEKSSIRLFDAVRDPVLLKPLKAIKANPIVLVVDDDIINQKVATRMLSSMGLDSELLSDGSKVLPTIQSNPKRYVAVLMDLHMPGMDGITATHKVREWEREREGKQSPIPIIAVTGEVLPDTESKCLAEGMNAYLSKPILITRLKQLLIDVGVLVND